MINRGHNLPLKIRVAVASLPRGLTAQFCNSREEHTSGALNVQADTGIGLGGTDRSDGVAVTVRNAPDHAVPTLADRLGAAAHPSQCALGVAPTLRERIAPPFHRLFARAGRVR